MLPACWCEYLMPIYYCDLQTGEDTVEDAEGSHLADLQAARHCALSAARGLLAHAIHRGRETAPACVVVVDAEGQELLRVYMAEVLPQSLRQRLS